MSSRCSSLAVSVVSAGVVACESDARPEWCAPQGNEPVVIADAVSQWEKDGVTLRFSELWRAGGLNEGEELAFPISVAAAPDGRLAIADFQLGEAVVVQPDGRWDGSWTRQGSGPGEVQRPLGVAWDEAGNLLIYDIGRHRIVRLSAARTLHDEIEVPPEFGGPILNSGGLAWTATAGDGSIFIEPLLPRFENVPSAADAVVLRWLPGLAGTDTIARAAVPIFPTDEHAGVMVPGAARPLIAPAAGGTFAVGGIVTEYLIRVMGEGREPIRTICRSTTSPPLTEIERGEAALPGWEQGPELERVLTAIRAAVRPEPAAFGRMFYDAAGRLWVQRERPAPFTTETIHGVAGASYDLFAASGEWLGEARAPATARILAATAGRAYALEESEEGALWIVAYRLQLMPRRPISRP